MKRGSKKEARTNAEDLFIQADGKITNVEIAKTVSVNPLTIGRWKRADQWEARLEELRRARSNQPGAPTIRKKEALERALRLYLDAAGNITNKDLATQVGVSPASIANWKAAGEWSALIQAAPTPVEQPAFVPEPISEPLEIEETLRDSFEEAEASDFALDELTSPGQFTQINKRMDDFLRRSHLTAGEVADLSAAKALLLDAVQTYLGILQELEMSSVGK